MSKIALQDVKDTERKSRIIGVSTHMETFRCYTGRINFMAYRHLSQSLQKSDTCISAAQRQEAADLTVEDENR